VNSNSPEEKQVEKDQEEHAQQGWRDAHECLVNAPKLAVATQENPRTQQTERLHNVAIEEDKVHDVHQDQERLQMLQAMQLMN
jgi:hypothetical protein